MAGVYLPPWLQVGPETYTNAMAQGAQIATQRRALRERQSQDSFNDLMSGAQMLIGLKEHKDEMAMRHEEASQKLQMAQTRLDLMDTKIQNDYDLQTAKSEETAKALQAKIDGQAADLAEKTKHNDETTAALNDKIAQVPIVLQAKLDAMDKMQDKKLDALTKLQNAKQDAIDAGLITVKTGDGTTGHPEVTQKVPPQQYSAWQSLQRNPGTTTNNIPGTPGGWFSSAKPPHQEITTNTPPDLPTFLATNTASAMPPIAPQPAPAPSGAAAALAPPQPQAPPAQAGVKPTPTREDVTYLAAHPETKDKFEAKFGTGSANQWLP